MKEVKVFFLVLFLCFISFQMSNSVFGLIISPSSVNLEDFSSKQETVFTVINDEFKPVSVAFSPDAYSLYLSDYYSVSPETFVLNPNEKKNFLVKSNFPEDISPQVHKLTLLSAPGSSEKVELTFRPKGDAKPYVSVKKINVSFNEDKTVLLLNIDFINKGNVFVFLTPTLIISNKSSVVTSMTYQKPLLSLSKEIFSVTLRYSVGNLKPGNYSAVLQTVGFFDDVSFSLEEVSESFVLEEKNSLKKSEFNFQIVSLIFIVFILVLGFLWMKEIHLKHLTKSKNDFVFKKNDEKRNDQNNYSNNNDNHNNNNEYNNHNNNYNSIKQENENKDGFGEDTEHLRPSKPKVGINESQK